MKIYELFEAISKVSSKIEKEKLLNENKSPLLDMILTDTYGPEKYNVKKYMELDCEPIHTIEKDYIVFHKLLKQLANRELTGDTARRAVAVMIGCFRKEDRMWLDRILNKNLKIGIGEKFSEDTGKTKKFPVALANRLEDVKNVDIYDGNWVLSRKLDGCRCLAFVNVDEEGVQVKFLSRQNKEFTTLDNLKPAYEKFFEGMTGEWVVDGEICLVDENGNESFHGLMSEIRRKNHTIEYPVHMIFDLLTAEEFWTGQGRTFDERKKHMALHFENWAGDNIRLLGQYDCTPKRMEHLMKRVEEEGWEGLMVRRTDVQYEGKRTNNLLKIKKFMDGEYVVKDVILGDLTYNTPEGSKNYHCVSALVIEHKGNIVKVGSGMTKEQRLDWVENPNNIVGKTINVRYFEETKDKKSGEYSLRFPTLYHIYENGRDV